MFYTFSKYITAIAISLMLVACASTDSVSDNEATVKPIPANEGNATDSPVVPTLSEAKKKASDKKPGGQKGTKLPKKAEEADKRIAQVKEIMKGKQKIQKAYEKKQRGHNPNAFYRFKREKAETRALVDDGVHDPAADLKDLQPPVDALKQLPDATFGNGVNWVAALAKHKITPRADQLGKKQQFTLDMNIPMEVPGTMNNVLFPHKAHTAWLACSNCHTAIFIMKRGGNPITMKKINNGEYCGVCHGKVAFPIADCNRCHSQKKQVKSAAK